MSILQIFIHSPANGYLSCLQFNAVINSPAKNILVHVREVLLERRVLHLGVSLLDFRLCTS